MIDRRSLLAAFGVALIAGPAFAQQTPSAAQIERSLETAPQMRIPEAKRVTRGEIRRRPELRRAAPSIDIQSINFAFGSSAIPYSEREKVEQIARALKRILRRRPGEVFLIEGHTDAVGSFESNLELSERRAASLKRDLVRYFNVPPRSLETVGYGEEYLLVPTQREEWRNRRVTIRRITDFIR